MDSSQWIAFGALLFTIATGGGAVIMVLYNNKTEILDRLQKNKDELETELNSIRMSAYEEYKTLRQEMQNMAELARREFGETVAALKEKITQVELWSRDEFQKARHSFYSKMEDHRVEIAQKLDRHDERLRQLEMFTAREMGRAVA